MTTEKKTVMVRISPKIAHELLELVAAQGTNVNRLTNRVMRKYVKMKREKALLASSNTMPNGVQP